MAQQLDDKNLARQTLLITGATGFIGSRLTTLALARGHRVRTLTRMDWSDAPAIPQEDRFFGTFPRPLPLHALAGVDAVVHCAAELGTNPRAAWAVNVTGSLALATQARAAGVGTFVFLSSQSASPNALSVYGQTKYAAERALLGIEGLRTIVLRPGLVTGPAQRGLYARLLRLTERLPVIPLLDAGQAGVQPIHVDDLCEAIFRCAERGAEFAGQVLCLGHPRAMSMRRLLRGMTRLRYGRPKPTLTLPLAPVECGLRAAEWLGLPLPINRNQFLGLRRLAPMDTAPSLRRIGLRLRPLSRTLATQGTAHLAATPLSHRAVRVLLIGSGRIGLVHAITLTRLRGVVLCGIVDPNPRALALLRGMGVTAPGYRDLDTALATATADAAIIATPPATHVGLAERCAAAGLAVLVEKPLALEASQLDAYERLALGQPAHRVQAGYVLLRNPHVAYGLAQLRAGRYGAVRGFVGLTLISLIQEAGSRRWEVRRQIAGGGAFINAGGHVLSMIHAAFGAPGVVSAQSTRQWSAEVEDSLVVDLRYPGFRGQQFCSWSIDGFPRQENTLVVFTDRGRLFLTGSVTAFVASDGRLELTHQLDTPGDFNLAPDYAGAGFAAEQHDLAAAARGVPRAAVQLAQVLDLERLLFEVYARTREVSEFSVDRLVVTGPPSCPPRLAMGQQHAVAAPQPIAQVIDLRDLTPASMGDWLDRARGGSEWAGFLLTPRQLRPALARGVVEGRVRVSVPDFLHQSRLLAVGRYQAVLVEMGWGGAARAGLAAAALLPTERGISFWVAAAGLLAAGLQQIPAAFVGTLFLPTYLTDLALALRRLDMLERLLRLCRQARPHARIGFQSNLADDAIHGLDLINVPVDDVSVLTAPGAPGMAERIANLRTAGNHSGRRITAEVGLAPRVVQEAARAQPEAWAFGADAVLIHCAAEPTLAREQQDQRELAWSRVFPGLTWPAGVS